MSRFPADRLELDAYPGPGTDLPVFYGDLDPNWHVNNVAMGRFFEHGRVVAHRETGLDDAARPGHFLSVRVAIDYLHEALFGTLHVRSRFVRVGTSSFTVEQAVWQEGRAVAVAEVVLVHVIDKVAAPLPEAVRALLPPQG